MISNPGAVIAFVLMVGWIGWMFWQVLGPPPKDAKRHKWARKMSRHTMKGLLLGRKGWW